MDVALREFDAWDDVGFHKAHAALVVDYPNQAEFVFQGLAPRQGPEAVLGVVQFLDRLAMLEKGERGDATREADADAVRELGRRGIGADERARLRALILVAQSSAATLVDPAAQDAEQHTKDLFALYCWYQRWTEIARAVVKGRTAALALGLAHRRSARVATDPEVGAPIAQPQAPVPAPSPAPIATSPSANGAIVPSA